MSSSTLSPLQSIPVSGQENLNSASGVLLVPNQLNHLDLRHVEQQLGEKKFFYLVRQDTSLDPAIKDHVNQDKERVIEITASPDVAALRQRVQEVTGKGAVVIYVPASAAAQPATLARISGEQLELLSALKVPVLPLYVLRQSELLLSIDAAKSPDDASFAYGEVLKAEAATVAKLQEVWFGLGEQLFSANPALDRNLAYALLLGLKKHGSKAFLLDGKDDKTWRYDKVLAAAIVLSKHIKTVTTKPRVGIILPPGFGGLVANLAVMFAGKVPVNLNFTASRAAVESAMKQAELDHYITADLFVRKLQTFPWPPNRQLTFLERLLPNKKSLIARWFILAKLLPASILAGMLGIAKKGGDKEALLLFTSGSSGDPKGVALTHRNLLANVLQFGSRLNMKPADGILGCLPLFHSFGCTVTLWFPVIQGINLVTYPTPLESKRLAELIHKHKVTLFVTTPTFLRGYLKGVNPELFASLKLVVTGAEKLPKTVAEAFQARFGKQVLEGYGLTETSPATNVNLPDPSSETESGEKVEVIPSYRYGSVGQLLPGMAIRISDVDTDEPLNLHQSGMIWFKGANVFTGYLKNPKKSEEVIKDGWFRTGDIGRVDADGFIYVEGRLSRFSKVGGEMVPHETVEEAVIKVLNLESESSRRVAIVGVPDEDKGEALVLLSSVPGSSVQQEILDLRYKLLDRGMPPLWIPKKMVRVPEIPILSSGKLDVKACEKVAKSAT